MINNELKKLSGSVLGIGLDDKKQDILNDNKKIVECYLLDNQVDSIDGSECYTKIIDIKKMHKVFKRKSFDYIVGDFQKLYPYLRTFIKNSIYLNKNKVYFYNLGNYDLDELEKRYARYGSKVDSRKNFIIVDNTKAKTNFLKNIYNYICDLFYDIIEYIGNLFVN